MSKHIKCGYVLIRLTTSLHTKFKLYATENEMSMQEILEEHIKKLIEDKKVIPSS